MANDYLPASDSGFDLWVANFASEIDSFATALGLTPAEVTAIGNARTDWSTSFTNYHVSLQNARGFAEQKENSRAEADALVRRTVRRIQTSPAMTNQMREVLRIPVPSSERTPVGPPAEAPLLALDWGTRGQMTLKYGPNPGNARKNGKPKGVTGVQVYVHEGGLPTTDTAWQFLTSCSTSKCVHHVSGVGSRTFAYRVRYVNGKGETGPWSAPAVGAVTL